METDTNTTESPPEPERAERARTYELTRATDGRMIAGVAQGISLRTGIWSGWIRAAFILLAFAGGFGVAAYAVLWVLIRADNEPTTIAQRFFAGTNSAAAWIGAGLIFIAMLIILGNVPFLSGGVVWAVGLLAVGFLLYSGDLPRLINEPDEPKEGVQQMTITTGPTRGFAPDEAVVGGGDNANTPPPPPPTPHPPTPPILPERMPPREKSVLGRLTMGIMVIALGVLALLDTATALVDPAPRHYVALGVTVLGVGLLVGTLAGRARWLILVGLLSLPFLFSSPAFEFGVTRGEAGTVFVTPATFDEVDGAIYEQGVGELVIDLRDLDWSGETVSFSTDLGIGQTTILIPEDVMLVGVGTVSIGEVELRGPFDNQTSAGLRAGLDFDSEGPNGVIELDSHVGIGSLEVRRLPSDNQGE